MPYRIVISIGTPSDTAAPASPVVCQPKSLMPVMWMNRLSGPNCLALASWSKILAMPKLPNTPRRPDSANPLSAASLCSGE